MSRVGRVYMHLPTEKLSVDSPLSRHLRAGDGTRTRDIFLGKEVLYQLSHSRLTCEWCLTILPLVLYGTRYSYLTPAYHRTFSLA